MIQHPAALKHKHFTSLPGATQVGGFGEAFSTKPAPQGQVFPNAGSLCGCFRNSYSLYCAELMANMKDVPSTERMVLCSQQWKLLSQKEKDAYHKKCDQVSS